MKTGIVVALSIIAVVLAVAIMLAFTMGKRRTRSNSRCPTLSPPEFVTATSGEDLPHKAVVTWSAVPGATTYAVYRSKSTAISDIEFDKKLFSTGTTVTFDDITSPTQYFRVSAFNQCGEGPLSVKKSTVVYCALDHPKNVNAQSINATNAQATWDAVLGAEMYHVYVNGVEFYSGILTSYTFSTPVPGNYAVQISTRNSCGEGPKSPAFNLNVPLIFI